MIPDKMFTICAKFKRIVSEHDFWFPYRLQELHQALLGLLGNFCFTRIRLDPLGGQVLYHHGISMIVSRFTFFIENFVFRCDQVTKMFRSGEDCANTSSARSPCYFRLQADITIWVLREVRKVKRLYLPNPVPHLLVASLEVHEMTWKCLDFFALGFRKDLLEYFDQILSEFL